MKIVILADCPFYEGVVHGGLQATYEPLIELWAHNNTVVLFCGVNSTKVWTKMAVHLAFREDFTFVDSASAVLAEELCTANILVSLETQIPKDVNGTPAVLILGGLAYQWSIDLAKSFRWQCIVTPSTDSAGKTRNFVEVPVVSIYNGYDWKLFPDASRSRGAEASNRLHPRTILHPHRPEIGKGASESVVVLSHLLTRGHDCCLLIPEQDIFTSNGDYYEELRRSLTGDLQSRVVFCPWISRQQLPHVYRAAAVTLALGNVEEGFGAAIVESIFCGTPVVASNRGAIPELFPPGHGLSIVPLGDIGAAVDEVERYLACTSNDLDLEMARGHAYVMRHYTIDRMSLDLLNLFMRLKRELPKIAI